MKTKLNLFGGALSILTMLGMSGCDTPDLNATTWSCELPVDCGPGFLCSDNACEPSENDINGITDTTLTFGISAAITTGPVELGQGMKDGILAYFKEVNDKGGIHGRRLLLTDLDDGYNPETALANVKTLIDTRSVFALMGNVGTPTAAVTVPYAVEQKALFYGAFTGAGLLRNDPPDRYVFNFRSSYKEETAAVVDYFTVKRDPVIQPRNIWVLPQGVDDLGNTDGFGQSGLDGVRDILKDEWDINSSEIGFWTYERNTVKVDNAALEFLKWLAHADRVPDNAQGPKVTPAIVMVPTADPAAAFIKKVRRDVGAIISASKGTAFSGLTVEQSDKIRSTANGVIFSSVSFVGSNALSTSLSGENDFPDPNKSGGLTPMCQDILVTQVVPLPSSSSSGVLDYKAALSALDSNKVPGFVSLEGYLAAKLFGAALEASGRELSLESFISDLEKLQGVDLGIGALLGFSGSDHQATHGARGSSMNDTCVYSEFDLR